MIDLNISSFSQTGASIQAGIYDAEECAAMLFAIENAGKVHPNFRQTSSVFAIRQVLEVVPELYDLIWNPRLRTFMQNNGLQRKYLRKSIFFDKNEGGNWFVAWHQDISINVEARTEVPGFSHWTQKNGITGVVPPLEILKNTLTLRIHLHDTDAQNGALWVVKGSHKRGILRKESETWDKEDEILCSVPAGGIMLMHPLTMHASRRADINSDAKNGRRSVIHLEFCDMDLPIPLAWAEHRKTPFN